MLIIILLVVTVLLYWYWTLPFSKWMKLNIPHIKPHFLWGNFGDVIYQKKAIFQIYEDIYRTYPNLSYVGVYIINRPGLLLRDPVLIKEVMQNNFPSFLDNDLYVDENADPIFAKNPFTSSGQKWRERRIVHTKPFSSGKIKYMFNQVEQGGNRMNKFLTDEISKKGEFTIEAMELAAKYTIYNIGNCGLGIDARTFDEDNAEMREMGRKIIEPNYYNGIKQFLVFILPNLSKLLSVTIVPEDVTAKFRRLVEEQLQYRKDNNIVRNDFFEAVQGEKDNKASLDDVIIQIGGFFIDGFVTSSSFLNFLLYELAINPDVQRKLAEEIDKFLAKHDRNITYVAFQEFQYLEAVVLEGLRKFPPLAVITRLCTKPFILPPPISISSGGTPLEIQPGTSIVMPIRSLHYDEKYFPNPNTFDPTRFLGQNKEKIQKFTFLPFGEGPRECLGKRFALIQNKMMILKLLSKFEIRMNPRTITPIEFDARSVLLAAVGGVWLDVYERKH